MSLSYPYHACLRFVDAAHRNKFYLRERSNYVTDTKHCFSLCGFTITSHSDIGRCFIVSRIIYVTRRHTTLILLKTAVFSLYDFQIVCEV